MKTRKKLESNEEPTKTVTTTSANTVKPEQLNVLGGNWVDGRIGEFYYQAKVFECGSQFGIHEGTISKLSIRHATTRKEVAAYDRGRDILPQCEHVQEMVDALVNYYHAK